MGQFFILAAVALTSVAAYLVAAKRLGLSGTGLRTALGRVLECMGLTLGFFAVNLAVGLTLILVGRLLSRGFVSLYDLADASLLILSLFQALIFLWWRQA